MLRARICSSVVRCPVLQQIPMAGNAQYMAQCLLRPLSGSPSALLFRQTPISCISCKPSCDLADLIASVDCQGSQVDRCSLLRLVHHFVQM